MGCQGIEPRCCVQGKHHTCCTLAQIPICPFLFLFNTLLSMIPFKLQKTSGFHLFALQIAAQQHKHFLIYLYVSVNLDCFQILATMNICNENRSKIYFELIFLCSWGRCQVVESLGHMEVLILIFYNRLHIVFNTS